jgi:hypothetical protein
MGGTFGPPFPFREYNRFVLGRNSIVETLYKTKTPQPSSSIEQCFELTLGEQTVDGQLGYFVRETQCWWDAAAKRAIRVQYTLSPRAGFANIEEARELYNAKRMARARHGFVHSFIPRYEAGRSFRYVRIEVPAPPEIDESTKR